MKKAVLWVVMVAVGLVGTSVQAAGLADMFQATGERVLGGALNKVDDAADNHVGKGGNNITGNVTINTENQVGNITAKYLSSVSICSLLIKGSTEEAVVEESKAGKMAESPENQFLLGMVLLEGKHAPKNVSEAAAWFKKAAKHGHAKAQAQLGELYLTGEGVPKSGAEAARWLWKAAENGSTESQFTLGRMYARGGEVPVDYALAHEWLERAATTNHVGAQVLLGCLFADGKGVEPDLATAKNWFTKAAQAGDAFAQLWLEREAVGHTGNIDSNWLKHVNVGSAKL